MDYSYFFFHLAFDLSSDQGIIAYLTPSYFITATFAHRLRKEIKEKTHPLFFLDFNQKHLFSSAKGQHNMVSIFLKQGKQRKDLSPKMETKSYRFLSQGFIQEDLLIPILTETLLAQDLSCVQLSRDHLFYGKDNSIDIGMAMPARSVHRDMVSETSKPWAAVIQQIYRDYPPLNELYQVHQGLLTGLDKITTRHVRQNLASFHQIGSGVYVLNDQEIRSLGLNKQEQKIVKPFFKNSDIFPFFCREEPQKYCLYLTRDRELVHYPHIEKHVQVHQKAIENRNTNRGEIQAALKQGKWWVIFAARDSQIFENPKILCPQRSRINTFAYTEKPWYASADVYYITQDHGQHSLIYLLGLLNSTLFYYLLYHRGKRKGEYLELYHKPLSELPIHYTKDETFAREIIQSVRKIQEATANHPPPHNSNEEISLARDHLHQQVFELYQISKKEQDQITSFYQHQFLP